jgi:hypothetical protein
MSHPRIDAALKRADAWFTQWSDLTLWLFSLTILCMIGALGQVKTLSGLLPICAWCKKIRDESGHWRRPEEYLSSHSEVDFTHSICPDCKKDVQGL